MAAILTRFQEIRRDRPLTDDELYSVAPSVFATEPHHSRSDRYEYIPTIDVLNGLRSEGFYPFMAAQSGTRTPGKRDYTKHMLRLRNFTGNSQNDANEIILINSHDGSSAYKMMAGMYRFVCANGLIIGDTMCEARIPHTGEVRGQVIEGAYTVVDNFDKVDERKDMMLSAPTTRDTEFAFARAALALRFDGDPDKAPYSAQQLLVPRRHDDDQRNMWSTFNRVQENLMKGGLRGKAPSGRRTRSHQIRNIDNNVNLNRALWVLGEEMAKIVRPVAV